MDFDNELKMNSQSQKPSTVREHPNSIFSGCVYVKVKVVKDQYPRTVRQQPLQKKFKELDSDQFVRFLFWENVRIIFPFNIMTIIGLVDSVINPPLAKLQLLDFSHLQVIVLH